MIEEHTNSCLKLYKKTSLVSSIDEQIKQIMSNAYKEFMCVKWPGIESNAIYNLIPLLRLNLFVEETLQVNVNINDAPQELNQIKKKIGKMLNNANKETAAKIQNIMKSLKPFNWPKNKSIKSNFKCLCTFKTNKKNCSKDSN